MKLHGIQVKRRRLYKTTTNSKHNYPMTPNPLDRQFVAEHPNQKWLTGITYVPTREGWLYLAAVLDLYSCKVVGWATDKHMEQGLVGSAPEMAALYRRPAGGLLHHSDRGSQYAANDYQRLLASHAMMCSMSGVGDCYTRP
jgi:putative transposase